MLDFGFYNLDCMVGMREFPDKYFDLAVCDPPYGIGYDTQAEIKGGQQYGKAATQKKHYHGGGWDVKPSQAYFPELLRVSKRQIIWGGNYYADRLPPSKCFIVWDKRCHDDMRNNFADCEYAWCSEDLGVARVFRYVYNGMIQGNMKDKEQRFHPTQKPVALYEWILSMFAEPNDIILDTHVGSASSLVACRNTGHKYVGFEIDETYYKLAKERLDAAEAQQNIFDYMKPQARQMTLFDKEVTRDDRQ